MTGNLKGNAEVGIQTIVKLKIFIYVGIVGRSEGTGLTKAVGN